MLGRIVFQAHPCVLFRAPYWESEEARSDADRILPALYESFMSGEIEEYLGSVRFPNYARHRMLRALCGYAVLKGNFDWLYSLALTHIHRRIEHDALLFLAFAAASLEGRFTLSEFFRSKLRFLPIMEALESGFRSPYDEGPSAAALDFFQPGSQRGIREFKKLLRYREAAEAALGWMWLSGKFMRMRTALRLYSTGIGTDLSLKSVLAPNRPGTPSDWQLDETPVPPGPARRAERMAEESRAGAFLKARLKAAVRALENGRFLDADHYLKHTLSRHPYVLHLRARAHLGLGELGLAAACYRRVVKMHPERAEFCENYGRILGDMGDAAGAEKALKRAEEIRHQSKRVYS